MAKIAFIQDNLYEYFGPMSLSAVLKKHDHSVKMFVLNKDKKVIKSLKKFNPDITAFSVVSGIHKWSLKFAKKIKKNMNTLVLFGGPHPTFFPETIQQENIDIIALGEGEYSILELADSIDKGRIDYKIKGLWFKKDKKIIKNPLRNLINDLDSLPFPDRELYYSKYPFLKNFPTKRFITSRGCPYDCSFCFNHKMKEMYKGKGIYIRRRSPRNVIEEIKQMKQRYKLKNVRFIDDSFTINHRWLFELLNLYKEEINLPFTCLVRANELNEKLIQEFKRAGCDGITFGIETADEKRRNDILHKSLTNEDIIKAAKLLRKYKIKFGTYNMIGLPGETIEDAIDTMKFNAKIKVNYPNSTIFQPYPKTELAEYCIKKGYIKKDFDVDNIDSMFQSSIIESKYSDQFTNLEKFFNIGVKFPSTIPLIRRLIKFKPNKLFSLIGFISYGIRSLASFKIGLKDAVKMGINMRSTITGD